MSFKPEPPPTNLTLGSLAQWAYKIFQDLAKVLTGGRDYYQLNPQGQEPAKYKPGQIFYADGIGWNPGMGEGPYVRTSTAWEKL